LLLYIPHFLRSFIHQWLYSPLLGPGLFFSFVNFFTQLVGHLGKVISPSQGRYLHTAQHKHRINAHTDIHALSGIRTHDPSVRESEDGSCFRPRGHRDLHVPPFTLYKFCIFPTECIYGSPTILRLNSGYFSKQGLRALCS
jgi:hypothetical protein